jgi:hypothetical protein
MKSSLYPERCPGDSSRIRALRRVRGARATLARELAQLAQASNFKTRAAKNGALDFTQLHKDWAEKLARTLVLAELIRQCL